MAAMNIANGFNFSLQALYRYAYQSMSQVDRNPVASAKPLTDAAPPIAPRTPPAEAVLRNQSLSMSFMSLAYTMVAAQIGKHTVNDAAPASKLPVSGENTAPTPAEPIVEVEKMVADDAATARVMSWRTVNV